MNANIEQTNNGIMGIVYILELETPLGNHRHTARFYTGWAKDLQGRIEHHRAGRGSAFTRAAVEAGINFHVVFTMPGTKNDERAIKNKKMNQERMRRFIMSQNANTFQPVRI